MILDIPFAKNPGNQCGQACALMILKYFYPKKKVGLKDFNKVIKYKPNKWTFPIQHAIALNHFGIKARAFSKENYLTGQKGIEQFKKWFGKDFKKIFYKKESNLAGYSYLDVGHYRLHHWASSTNLRIGPKLKHRYASGWGPIEYITKKQYKNYLTEKS